RNREEDRPTADAGGYGPSRQREEASRARGAFEPEESDEEEEIFSMAKFQPARVNLGPSSGSNLRAWALAAAKEESDQESDDELDWLAQRRQMRGGGNTAPGSVMPSSLPSMQAPRRNSEEDDSGSDVEPVFFRR
ncbi:Hypothetical protein SCF082_LOCUS45317, partial [Durusdinium trenchii]